MSAPDRPRDRLGRPLARDDDAALAVPGVPPRSWLSSAEALAEAETWLARGMPFHAHEVYEQRWRCCPGPERAAWRAMAQYAAARTHAARGNAVGARALAERAAAGLRSYAGPSTGIPVEQVLAECARLSGCGRSR